MTSSPKEGTLRRTTSAPTPTGKKPKISRRPSLMRQRSNMAPATATSISLVNKKLPVIAVMLGLALAMRARYDPSAMRHLQTAADRGALGNRTSVYGQAAMGMPAIKDFMRNEWYNAGVQYGPPSPYIHDSEMDAQTAFQWDQLARDWDHYQASNPDLNKITIDKYNTGTWETTGNGYLTHFAACHGLSLALTWMLDHGADVDALIRRNGNWTPLMYAAEGGGCFGTRQVECIKTLLEHGAQRDLRNTDNETAAEVARRCKKREAANFIDNFIVRTRR